jgi:hypothetical protein
MVHNILALVGKANKVLWGFEITISLQRNPQRGKEEEVPSHTISQ